jgi:quinone-modifying oxidoreductase subunit QmoB
MANRLGVYICSGCGIGGSIDTQRLVAAAEKAGGPVRTSKAFCLEDASLIKADVETGDVDTVVIAACSPRVNTEVFGIPSAIVQRVNLREQVAWSHPVNHEETQSLAEDYLQMGIVEAQKKRPPVPYKEANEQRVLVVGGGIAGINAAISAARSGFDVVLVEKGGQIGGFAGRLYKQFPSRPPYHALSALDLPAERRALEALLNVKVYVNSHVVSVSGQPGRFNVVIGGEQDSSEITAGAIVLATGWNPGPTDKHRRYGLGVYKNVVSSIDFEEMAGKGAICRPSDNRPAMRIAFLLCDGKDDDAHLPYGGNVSTLVALKQAVYVRERKPAATAYIFYGDMQAPGQYEYFYKSVQTDPGILFSHGRIQGIREDEQGDLVLEVSDSPLGGDIQIGLDLIVLATDMTPATAESESALGLQYLQGDNLPTTRFGFADSNFICFPYETRRTGIYSAGGVRQAMDLEGARRDGRAAALKAIQSIEKSSAGQAVHPRVGDLSYPTFFMQKCTSCGRCTQECPFGALELNERKNPVLNTNRCRRCGICMGACPVQIISFNDYSVDILSSMIRSVEIPEGDQEKPRILVFACENDAYPAIDMTGIKRLHYPVSVRVIPVRCLGSINSILITDAVSRGFDGVALMGCKPGDDYQCHFIRGSQLLDTRMGNMQETLGRLMLEPERVQVMEVEISDSDRIPGMLEEFVDRIKQIGPNPMKGF